MGRIGLGEIIVIVLVVVMIFGAKRIPEISKAIAKSIKEFKKASKEEVVGEETKDDK